MKRSPGLPLVPAVARGGIPLKTVSPVSFTVYGSLTSMKNSRILTSRRGAPQTIPNWREVHFRGDFAMQVPPNAKKALGSRHEPLRAMISVWYPSFRNDLDCALIYDLLQECGVVSNDRWIREKHEYAHVDGVNPRVEIIVELL